jgi:hypothetical protein
MIVSRVAREFIRNMKETEDSIKTEMKYENDGTTPKYGGYVEIILHEMKTTERK